MPGCTPGCCKRWGTYITMATFFLAGGIEYSVIFPTMYNYVEVMGGQEWLYGLSLSAFSISNLVTSPLYGIVFDKLKQTKWIVLLGNLFEIGGNFMYFAAYATHSPYLILGSRFLVGVGAGAGAALFAEMALISSKKQRTTMYSLFMALRQLGMVIGPAFNLLLEEAKFSIGPFPVNNLSSPGLFMAFLWIIVELLFILFFFQLPRVEEHETQPVEPYTSKHNTATLHKDTKHAPINENDCVNEDECAPLMSQDVRSSPVEKTYGTTSSPTQRMSSPTISNSVAVVTSTDSIMEAVVKEERGCLALLKKVHRKGVYLLNQMLREEIVYLLGILFVTMFNQAAIETMFVPLAENLLKWEEKDISFFYSGAGLEIILAFLSVSVLSRKLGDRWLLLIGLVFDVVGWGWLIGLVGNATSETPWVMWRYIVGGVIVLWGLPFVLVPGTSLYSKLLPVNIQGFGQGFRRSCFSVGAILGPLWAGGAVSFGNTYYVLLAVPAGLYVIMLFMVPIAFGRLKEPSSNSKENQTISTARQKKPS